MREPLISLQLDEDLRSDVERELCRRAMDAIAGAADRNAQLQTWRDHAEGLGEVAPNKTWVGACELFSPIIIKALLTLGSQITQALHRDPKVAVEAFDPQDAENARLIEQYLQMAGNKINIEDHLYDAATNAVRDPAVVIYCGWKQSVKEERKPLYRREDQEDNAAVPEEEADEDQTVEVPGLEMVEEEGYDIRVPDLADFFLDPPNAQSVEAADGVYERIYVTRNQLYDGIEDLGYDREAVERLIATAANDLPESKVTQDSQDGVQDSGGVYTIVVGYTRLPFIHDGEGGNRIPKYLRKDLFLTVLCPELSLVLKLDFSPYGSLCPYFSGGIIPIPNRFQGRCMPAILEAFYIEDTANRRFTIDSMNITNAPMMKVKKTSAPSEENNWSMGVGQVIPVDEMDDIEPLIWARSPINEYIAMSQSLQNDADGIVSAEGQGELSQKVRKTAEIQNVVTQANSKFGLFLWNFQRTVVGPIYERMVLLAAHFQAINEQGEAFILQGREHRISPDALRGRYRFIPAATSLTYSPEARRDTWQANWNIQTGYLAAKQNIPDPMVHKLLWHGAREGLLNNGEYNPEAWIGPEPQTEQPQIPQGEPLPPPYQPPIGGIQPLPGLNAAG